VGNNILRYGLFVILILSAFIRFWGIVDIPFTYDELSAIFRAGADTWNEHWQQGVMPDGHPPGMQTLIWFWVQCFGEHASLMHALMAVFSVGAVYLVYKTARNLTTTPKALATALFYSLSWLPLVWGQQIRPYALGMFFCNAFFWQWSLVWTEKRTDKTAFLLMGLLAAACAWLHYFALLPIFLLWLLGLAKQSGLRQKWLLSAVTGLLVFAPALPVFMHQLAMGGLDWLGKPGLNFPIRHLQYLLNGTLYPILGALIIIFFWRRQSVEKNTINMALLCFSVLLFPMAIGFAWSWLHKPVLQHSVLLFSAPFFFLGLIILIPDKKLLYVTPVITLLLGFGMLKSGYFGDARKDVYHEQAKVLKSACGEKKLLLADGPEDVLMYHLFNEHDVCLPKFISHSQIPFSYSRLWNTWKDWPSKNNPIVLAVNSGSHPGIIPLLEHWTGKEATHQYFIGGELVYLNDSFHKHKVQYQSVVAEAGKPKNILLENAGYQKNDLLVIHVPNSGLSEDAELVGSLHNGDQQIDWRSARKHDFDGVADESLFLFVKTADIPGVNSKTRLSILLKNNKSGDNTKILYRLCRANPMMYGPEWFE
jgi:hypothetical protein